MKHTFLLLAALSLTTAGFCQNSGTKIEVNLTDVPAGYKINFIRFDNKEGHSILIDSSNSTKRTFTINCDPIDEATFYSVRVYNGNTRNSTIPRSIYIKEGFTSTVSGSSAYPNNWTISSKHPKQAFDNTLNDAAKDLYTEVNKLYISMDTVTSNESINILYDMTDELEIKIEEKELDIMKTLPIDDYWLERFKMMCSAINYEGKDYANYQKIEEVFNLLPEEHKNSKMGKSMYMALYGNAPQKGDEIIDYDLYDADGKLHHLADYKGKWMLLDFSTYYCGPCRMFGAAVKYFYQKGIGKNIEMITIINDTKEEFAQMAETEKYISPLFHDRDEKDGIFALYKVSAYPTFFVVNPEGKLQHCVSGFSLGYMLNLFKEVGAMPKPEIKKVKGGTVINYPESDKNSGLWLESVELYKDSTVLNVSSICYSIGEGSTIKYNNGKNSCQLLSSSIGLNQYTSFNDGMKLCRLTFAPLPKGTKTFDFIEGDCDGCFKIEGVKIEE